MKIAIIGFNDSLVSQLAHKVSAKEHLEIIADAETNVMKSLIDLDYDKYFYAYHFQEMMDRHRDFQGKSDYILTDSYMHDEGAIEIAYNNHFITEDEHRLFQNQCKDYTNMLASCDVIYYIETFDISAFLTSQIIRRHLPLSYFEECYKLFGFKIKHLKESFTGTWIDVNQELSYDDTSKVVENTSTSEVSEETIVVSSPQPEASITLPTQTFNDKAKEFFKDYLPDVVIVEDERLKLLIELFQQGKDLSSSQYAAIKDETISCLKIVNDEKITVDEFFELNAICEFFDQVYE